MAHGLGFADEDLDRALDTFSGGQLTRASLARALATGADVLLLDEPTNHLDIESLEWLEQTLVELDAAVVLVAHDRWFLEAVGTAVLELEAGRSRFFAGTLASVAQGAGRARDGAGQGDRRAAGRDRADGALHRALPLQGHARPARRSRASRSSRRSSASSATRATGKALEFQFAAPRAHGPRDLRAARRTRRDRRECGDGRPRSLLLEHAELWLERGEHVSLVGPNGSGKTTLIETLAGRRELAAGKLRTGHNVKVGYLSQHADELGAGGDPEQSVLDAAQRATGADAGQGARAARPLPVLRRGGREAARGPVGRRAPAAVAGDPRRTRGANVLILDEPTNHLDIESREALEDALRAFAGAVLLVSHDRALLDAVGTRTVAVEERTLHSYSAAGPSTCACARSAAPPAATGAAGRRRRRRARRRAPARRATTARGARRRHAGEPSREARSAKPSPRARRRTA